MNNHAQYKEKIIQLYKSGKSYRDIADIMNNELNTNFFYYEGIRSVCRAYRRKVAKDSADKGIQEAMKSAQPNIEFGIVPDKGTRNKKNKILILNDLHIPYQIDEVYDIVRKHKNEINMIIFGGDLLDMKCVSSFPELNKPTIEEELIAGLTVLKNIKKIVGNNVKMVLIYGNHEMRIQRYIASLPNKELSVLLNPRVLEMLRDGFTTYKDGKTKTVYQGIEDLIVINSWYVVVNHKLIVSHPNNYSKAVGKNADQAIEYFIDRGEEFDILVAAHNHHSSEHPDHFRKKGIESGCLCKPMEYGNRRTNGTVQDLGYVIITFDKDGNVDKNESRVNQLPRQIIQEHNQIEM